jgi:hypothetical protein
MTSGDAALRQLMGQVADLQRQVERLRGKETGFAFVPLTAPLTSTSWDGDARSTTAKTLIDLSAVFGAPAGIKAAVCKAAVRDSASAGVATFQGLILAPNNTADVGIEWSCNGITNDAFARGTYVVPCDANGDLYFQTVASGAGTLDVHLQIWGYWL